MSQKEKKITIIYYRRRFNTALKGRFVAIRACGKRNLFHRRIRYYNTKKMFKKIRNDLQLRVPFYNYIVLRYLCDPVHHRLFVAASRRHRDEPQYLTPGSKRERSVLINALNVSGQCLFSGERIKNDRKRQRFFYFFFKGLRRKRLRGTRKYIKKKKVTAILLLSLSLYDKNRIHKRIGKIQIFVIKRPRFVYNSCYANVSLQEFHRRR